MRKSCSFYLYEGREGAKAINEEIPGIKCPKVKWFMLTLCILLSHLAIFFHCLHKQIYLDKGNPKVLLSGKSPLCLLFLNKRLNPYNI